MVANTDIPEVMESTRYVQAASYAQSSNPSDPVFLEQAEYLHEHGYFKQLTVQELRDELHRLYRNKIAAIPHEPDDVWK